MDEIVEIESNPPDETWKLRTIMIGGGIGAVGRDWGGLAAYQTG